VAWQQITLRLPARDYPRAEALLQLAGAISIAISDDGDSPILEPEPETTPLWPTLMVRALFDANANIGALSDLLGSVGTGAITLEQLDDESVAAGTPEPIRAHAVGPRLTIVPAEDLAEGDPVALGLHMGLAFGTGQHPTTQLCLEWLEQEMQPGPSVLDFGAGSGVLALAALKLGAAHATAVDIEPQSLDATRRNAELNGLEGRVRLGPPDIAGDRKYDLILANILARPLLELADSFAGLQAAGGLIVLSGVLVSQLDELETGYRRSYTDFSRKERSGWGLLTAVRRNGYDR
jgi:ribosomal protein L11 methyltransferase